MIVWSIVWVHYQRVTGGEVEGQMRRFLLEIGTSDLWATGRNVNFWDEEVKSQGHTTPKLDLESWWMHHS